MNLFDREDIENRFGFHKGTIEGENATAPKHRDLRIAFMQFAEVLAEALPDGRAKALAFTELEAASMWAHKAIAETAPVVHEKGRMDWLNLDRMEGPQRPYTMKAVVSLSEALRQLDDEPFYLDPRPSPFSVQEIRPMAEEALAREEATDDLCDAIKYGEEPAPSRDMTIQSNNPFRRL